MTGFAGANLGKRDRKVFSPAQILEGSVADSAHPDGLMKFRHLETERRAAQYNGLVPTDWGTTIRGVASGFVADGKQVALTLDACGGPTGSGVDYRILDTLRRNQIPATLFLNSRWIEANQRVATDVAADPLFTLANHGTRHVPLSVNGRSAYNIAGTHSASEAVDEVWGNHQVLTQLTGHEPSYFRAGTAYYDDVAIRIVSDLGETPVGFTVNGDCGATSTPAAILSAFGTATSGSIILAHMNQPSRAAGGGVADAVLSLKSRGWQFVGLKDRQLLLS